MKVALGTSFLISKELARRVCQHDIGFLCSHIDTLDREAYAQVHTNPKTLEAKIRGLHNLLDAGFPRERIVILITLTRPILPSLQKTIDWYVDEIGIKYIGVLAAKGIGFGNSHREWEPSLTDFRQAHEYRAQKLGNQFLRIGVGDLGKFFCHTYFQVHFDGHVSPCNTLRELSVGNVYEESLTRIFEKNRDFLLHHHEIKGKCGDCENNDVCFGCRANAFYYLGDVQASDPKCWLNPAAPEYCYSSKE
jgi:radical SAM protein with 4Fe4S-binding SPASM domain